MEYKIDEFPDPCVTIWAEMMDGIKSSGLSVLAALIQFRRFLNHAAYLCYVLYRMDYSGDLRHFNTSLEFWHPSDRVTIGD